MAAVCVLMFALMMGLLESVTTGLSSTTIVPTATNRPPMLLVSIYRIRFLPPQEKICDNCTIDALFQKKWILEHPIKIGLSVAVIILSK